MSSGFVVPQFGGLTLVTPPVGDPVSVADLKAHSRQVFNTDDSVIAGYIAAATRRCEDMVRRAFMPQTWRLALQHWPGRDYVMGLRQSNALADYWRWNHIQIPKPPLVSITDFHYLDVAGNSFPMQQGFGNTIGNYLLDTDSEPGRILLPFATPWPTTVLLPGNSIFITYVCGFVAFAGVCNYASTTGIASWVSGNKFAPGLQGTWITINGLSYNVASFTDDQHLVLMPPSGGATNADVASGKFTANTVPMPIRQAILLFTAHLYENREPVVVGKNVTEMPMAIRALLADYKIVRDAA